MVLDIITALLIVIPMGIGMARGFLYILVRFAGWLGALAAGVFLGPTLTGLLKDSPLGALIRKELEARFAGPAADINESAAGLPGILQDSIGETVRSTTDLFVETLYGLIMTMIGFLALVILVRLLLIFVIRPLCRRANRGKVAFPNKLGGLLVGGAEGLLLAFLFLAALIPVMNTSTPETAAAIAEQIRFSYLAGSLYDGNLLLAIFG